MLVWLVLRSLGHQRFDTLQDLAVGGHLPKGRCTDSHSIHLPLALRPTDYLNWNSLHDALAVRKRAP
jgi:hypothetical protein